MKGLFNFGLPPTLPPSVVMPSYSSLSAQMTPSILVIDRDEVSRDAIIRTLRTMKAVVHAVDYVEKAYVVLENILLDAVIASLSTEDPTDIDFVIEAKVRQYHIKLILLSERPLPEQISIHVDAFISKPFSPTNIRDTMMGVALNPWKPKSTFS